MTEYEIVTVANRDDPDAAPLVQWQCLCTRDVARSNASVVVVVEETTVDMGGIEFEAAWCRFVDEGAMRGIGYYAADCIPFEALDRGWWRRPVAAPPQRTEPEGEADALARFFATPAGKWRGFSTSR